MTLHSIPTSQSNRRAGEPTHLAGMHYASIADALEDTYRVVQDIEGLTNEQVVIPADQLLFLVRRALTLVEACQVTIEREGRTG